MKVFNFTILFLTFTSILLSCGQKDDITQTEENKIFATDALMKFRVNFAKALAKSLKNEKVRELIKKESLEKFDNEYDVLYHKVKNKKLDDKYTFESYIYSQFEGLTDFYTVTKSLPLLNILVPSFFGANKWNIREEIPLVAVRNEYGKLILFNQNGESEEVNPFEMPDYPVIIVNENERVITDKHQNGNLSPSGRINGVNYIMTDKDVNYYYIDQYFNPLIKKSGRYISSIPSGLDNEVINAYSVTYGCNYCSHRDYIYYGIYAGKSSGALNIKYAEAITAIKMTSPNDMEIIGGWDEGTYVFRITALFGSRTASEVAASSDNLKLFSVKPEDLFTYHTERRGGFLGIGAHTVKVADGVKEYVFPFPITFVTWDMEKFGDRWKIAIEEYDQSVTIQKTMKETSTYGTNFSVNAGVKEKVSANFGSSSSFSKETSITYTSTEGSDEVGSATMQWTNPVLTYYNYPPFVSSSPIMEAKTFELSTGVARISFETIRISQ